MRGKRPMAWAVLQFRNSSPIMPGHAVRLAVGERRATALTVIGYQESDRARPPYLLSLAP